MKLITVKQYSFVRTILFCVNSGEHGDAKIKSSSIISNERIREEDMTNYESLANTSLDGGLSKIRSCQ